MKWKILIMTVAIALVITISSVFLEIVPCTKWSGSSAGDVAAVDFGPKKAFCNVRDYRVWGPTKPPIEFFYITENPYVALVIIFVISIVIISLASLVIHRIVNHKNI